jgi:hypothetical protein
MAIFGNICLRARSGDGLTVPFAPPGWRHPAVVLFFVMVNQVLVRLWARVPGQAFVVWVQSFD